MVQKLPERVRIIKKSTVRSLLALSHFAFRMRLIEKAKELGRRVLVVNEAFTTKTCGSCGKLNDVGASKVYQCGCGYCMDRDVHGSRNIFIRYITKNGGDSWV